MTATVAAARAARTPRAAPTPRLPAARKSGRIVRSGLATALKGARRARRCWRRGLGAAGLASPANGAER
jgi:hypothetical protein